MKKLPPNLKEFCRKQELLRFAYLNGKGYPRVVPLWFVIINDNYYVVTGAASAKRKAIERNPRAGWVIDGGERDHYKAASMYGRVEEVTDAGERQDVYNAMAAKYYASPDHPKMVETFGKVDDPETVYWRLAAEDGTSWEY